MKSKSFTLLSWVILSFCLSTFAFAALTSKEELVGKQYVSADRKCTVIIEKNEYWKTECDHLKGKYPSPTLSGQGIKISNCYGSKDCEALEFIGSYSRPLQAFILRDPKEPTAAPMLGLVYGSPADGLVEILKPTTR